MSIIEASSTRRPLVAREAVQARIELEQAVQGHGLALRGLRQALRRAPGRRREADLEAVLGEELQNGADDGGLSDAGAARDHDHAVPRDGEHRFPLRGGELDLALGLERQKIRLRCRERPLLVLDEQRELLAHRDLGAVQARGVDGAVLHDHALGGPERVDGGLGVRLVDLEHLRGPRRKLVARGVGVPLLHQGPELVQHARLRALRVVARDPEGAGELVRRLEADPAHVEREPIRRALHHARGAVAVVLVDAEREPRRSAVHLQEHHDRAYGALRAPGALDLLHAARAEAAHLGQPRGLFVEHPHGIEPEGVDDALGVGRTYPWNDAGTKIASEPLDRRGIEHDQHLGLELLAVTRVDHEFSRHSNARARAHGLERPDHHDRPPATAGAFDRAEAEHAKTRLLVLVGDALYFAAQRGRHEVCSDSETRASIAA
jgi:hypothetical protein